MVTAEDNDNNESANSAEVSATPADTTPPAAPTGLTATAGDQQVSLDWDDNTERDLAGYNVYQSTSQGGPYTKLNTSLLVASAYTDTGLTNGTAYYYVVTAEDNDSNVSAISAEVSATPTPAPTPTPTSTPTPIPGLSAAGILVLAGMLALLLIWRLRRGLAEGGRLY